MAGPRWSRRAGWMGIAAAALCVVALAVLMGTAAMESGKGLWAAAFLVAIGAIAAVTAFFATDGPPRDARHGIAWLQPRPIAVVFVAIFIGFGTMTDALALFQQPPAVESQPGAIENGVREIRAAIAPVAAGQPRILLKLPGVWGEPGCAVTYRFRINEAALLVDSVRRPPGAPPHHLVATIISAEGDILNAVGEQPASARGKAATFSYANNGVIDRLTWDDQVGPVSLELDRCP